MPEMIITKTMGRSFLSIFLIFLLQNSTPLQTASAADKKLQDVKTIEEMVVTGSRIKKEWERQYKSIAGKRIFTGPYGESKYVIAISQELKNRGEKKACLYPRYQDATRIHIQFTGSLSLPDYR